MSELDSLFNAQRAAHLDVGSEAATLLTMWRKLERSHLPISFGCSCGGMGHVRVQDFEQDVLDYLRDKHAQSDAALAIIKRFTAHDDRRSSAIGALLQGIAHDRENSDAADKQRLVADLRRSITSWSHVLGPVG